jgi:hypothetical protein
MGYATDVPTSNEWLPRVESRHCAAGLASLVAVTRETHPRPVSPPAEVARR